jgi:hypothetical protein
MEIKAVQPLVQSVQAGGLESAIINLKVLDF